MMPNTSKHPINPKIDPLCALLSRGKASQVKLFVRLIHGDCFGHPAHIAEGAMLEPMASAEHGRV